MLEIIQGEQQPYSITINKKKDGKITGPLDLTGNVEIKVLFKIGATIITKLKTTSQVTVVSAILGQISGNLLIADTDLMTAGTDGVVEIHVDYGSGNVKKLQILNAFKVFAKIG